MFEMFLIVCITTMTECTTMYENPSRTFKTYEQCQIVAVEKEKWTRQEIGDSVLYMQVGCKKKVTAQRKPQSPSQMGTIENENSLRNTPTI